MRIRYSLLSVSFLGLAAFALPLTAQVTGSMSGTVLDPDGALLPGVAVSVSGSRIPTATTYTQSNGVYRFPALPPAEDYSLEFRLQGFERLDREGLVVRVGGNARIDVSLGLEGVTEAVTVFGATPLIDVTNTSTGSSITERYMQAIPSARDPWAMLEHTPGVQVSSQNVGGSGSGNQSRFAAYGSEFLDNVWTYDGAEVSGGLGFSDLYYDFDAFEEISITTAGNDASVMGAGIHINFVTRRGGNQWRGSGRFYLTDAALQGTTGEHYSEDELFPGYIGNSIDDIRDYGLEIGGPAVRDRVFVWGAFGKQDINTFVGETPLSTQITNWHAKGNWHINDKTTANFTFVHSLKSSLGRQASVYRPFETTQDLRIPVPVYIAKVQHAFDDNHYLEADVSHMPEHWGFDAPGGRDTQTTRDYWTGVWGNTYNYYDARDTGTNARVDGTSYLPGSTDHELRYGYNFRRRSVDDAFGWPQGVIAVSNLPYLDDGDLAFKDEAWLTQEARMPYDGTRHSLYAGDTLSTRRLTINAGLRFDHQTSRMSPSTTPAHPLVPDILPAASFPGFDPGWGWNSLSPRLGITYDLNGEARTVLRLYAGRYYSPMQQSEFYSQNNATNGRGVDFEWADANGDGLVGADELGRPVWVSPGWNPFDPEAPSRNMVTETSPPWTNELIAGIDHEISRSLAVGANFIYRNRGNYSWAPKPGADDPNNWEQVTQDVPGYGELTVYQPVAPFPNYTVYKQRPHYRQRYTGLEVFVTRRFADGWMANASFNYGQPIQTYGGPGAFTDPTNIARKGDSAIDYGSWNGSWGAARWYLRASGMYQLPAGFSLAGYFQAREGNINAQYVRSNRRANGAGSVNALVEDMGDTRLPTFWNLDLRAEKTFALGARGRLHLIVDAFNLTNNAAILARVARLNSPFHGRITDVLQGRTIRFGLRMVLR